VFSQCGNEFQDKVASANEDEDEAEWEKCQSKLAKSKERALEGKSKISHPVHCPYFPDVRQKSIHGLKIETKQYYCLLIGFVVLF